MINILSGNGTKNRFRKHPDYISNITKWKKYRLTMEGGRAFIDEYLQRITKREKANEFETRKKFTYCPAHAKSVLVEIRNAFFQRIQDVIRTDGPKTYQDAIKSNVDSKHSSMDIFISTQIVLELLAMSKVGVFIDKPPQGTTKREATVPYIYKYGAEQIWNWDYDDKGELTVLLLEDTVYTHDENGLVKGSEKRYRLLKKVTEGVSVEIYDKDQEKIGDTRLLKLKRIPFVIFEISQSLLTDVADYQVALLNMESSDIQYIIKANFPFYTEQYNAAADFIQKQQQKGADGTEEEATTSDKQHIAGGPTQGRRYAQNLERPKFIHPSPEPLKASMEKEDKVKADIRTIIGLALESVEPRRVSAESKKEDRVSKEEGLAAVGAELEHGETGIAQVWADYEDSEPATVKYPRSYSLRTEEDRRKEAKELYELMMRTPSTTYQKTIARNIVSTMIGHKIPTAELLKAYNEIEAADIIQIEQLTEDVDKGILSAEQCGKYKNYPSGDAKKAQDEKAKRVAVTLDSQSPAARGAPDLGGEADLEKEGKKGRGDATSDDNGAD